MSKSKPREVKIRQGTLDLMRAYEATQDDIVAMAMSYAVATEKRNRSRATAERAKCEDLVLEFRAELFKRCRELQKLLKQSFRSLQKVKTRRERGKKRR
jgi:hypothetical protein